MPGGGFAHLRRRRKMNKAVAVVDLHTREDTGALRILPHRLATDFIDEVRCPGHDNFLTAAAYTRKRLHFGGHWLETYVFPASWRFRNAPSPSAAVACWVRLLSVLHDVRAGSREPLALRRAGRPRALGRARSGKSRVLARHA